MITADMVSAAIARVEDSRRSHVEWAEHLTACSWCAKDETTQRTVGSIQRQRTIVAEYDVVLEVLRSVAVP